MLTIADLLSHENDHVVSEALALLSELLEEGNEAAQQAFESHFLGLHG